MHSRFKPVDILSLTFIGLLTVLTLVSAGVIPLWGWLILRYGMLLIAVLSLSFYTGRSNTWKPASYLHAFLPVFVIPVLFDSLGDLIPWIWPRYCDDVLIQVDYLIFGAHPTVWMERFIRPALTTALQFAYISYYPMAIVLGAVLMLKKKRTEFDEAVFGIVLCFYLSYIGYITVPAVGPRFTLIEVQTQGLAAGPLTLAIQETLNTIENTKTDAFPSGHTAVALMTLYYAWKSKEKALTALLLPVVLALIFSTVYLRYHYVVDIAAGVLLSGVTIFLAPRARQWLAGSGDPLRDEFHNAS